MAEDTIHSICGQLGAIATLDHGTYLGLPSSIGHMKIDILGISGTKYGR